jgi:hypothetical protein
MKGDSVMATIDTLVFEGSVDTVHFGVKVETDDYQVGDSTIIDGKVKIYAKVWKPGESAGWEELDQDISESRKVEGYGGIIINDNNIDDFSEGIKIQDVTIKKVD